MATIVTTIYTEEYAIELWQNLAGDVYFTNVYKSSGRGVRGGGECACPCDAICAGYLAVLQLKHLEHKNKPPKPIHTGGWQID